MFMPVWCWKILWQHSWAVLISLKHFIQHGCGFYFPITEHTETWTVQRCMAECVSQQPEKYVIFEIQSYFSASTCILFKISTATQVEVWFKSWLLAKTICSADYNFTSHNWENSKILFSTTEIVIFRKKTQCYFVHQTSAACEASTSPLKAQI